MMHVVNNLRAIDLNLLVVLDTLLAERHVSRAAARLGMSQPAVSHALNRLRHLLGDELLIKGPGGLRPTAKAMDLADPLREALDRLRDIVGVPVFDPGTSTRTFRLAMSDYGALVVLPGVLRRLRQEAPGMSVIVTQDSREAMVAQIMDAELDGAVGVFPDLPADIRSALLFQERFICVADRQNAACRSPMTLESYLRMPHLLVSVKGEAVGEVEVVLASLGVTRRIAAIMPHFLVAPQVVAGTDLVLTLARRGVSEERLDPRLRTFDPPFQIAPFPFVHVWHRRSDDDPAHAWLRRILAETAAGERGTNDSGIR